MKKNFLLISIIAAIITGCSSSYKTAQTPDDVYYSPARIESHEVRRENENKSEYDNPTGYSSVEDRDIRRRINNRRYRRYDDRYDSPYGYNNYPYGYNNYPPVYVNPKTGKTSNQPRQTNLGAYKPSNADSTTSYNPKLGSSRGSNSPSRTFENNNSSTNRTGGVGNFIRRVLTPESGTYNSGSNSNNTYRNDNSNSTSTRTFESRSSNNNSNSNSTSSETKTSSGSAPVRTFKKDN